MRTGLYAGFAIFAVWFMFWPLAILAVDQFSHQAAIARCTAERCTGVCAQSSTAAKHDPERIASCTACLTACETP